MCNEEFDSLLRLGGYEMRRCRGESEEYNWMHMAKLPPTFRADLKLERPKEEKLEPIPGVSEQTPMMRILESVVSKHRKKGGRFINDRQQDAATECVKIMSAQIPGSDWSIKAVLEEVKEEWSKQEYEHLKKNGVDLTTVDENIEEYYPDEVMIENLKNKLKKQPVLY